MALEVSCRFMWQKEFPQRKEITLTSEYDYNDNREREHIGPACGLPQSVFQAGISGTSPFSQTLNKSQESRPWSWEPEVTITASSLQNHVALNTKILSFSMN